MHDMIDPIRTAAHRRSAVGDIEPITSLVPILQSSKKGLVVKLTALQLEILSWGQVYLKLV